MMDMRIDDKGKYFTPRIVKDLLPAFIRTADHVIIGNMYARPEQRLKDELNEDTSRFLAITDARVYAADSEQLLYRSALMMVAYDHIVMLSPLEAHEHVRDVPWYANHTDAAL